MFGFSKQPKYECPKCLGKIGQAYVDVINTKTCYICNDCKIVWVYNKFVPDEEYKQCGIEAPLRVR